MIAKHRITFAHHFRHKPITFNPHPHMKFQFASAEDLSNAVNAVEAIDASVTYNADTDQLTVEFDELPDGADEAISENGGTEIA